MIAGANAVKKLNSNLMAQVNGIDIRYNSTDSAPEWSIRGADTWSPFSSKPDEMQIPLYIGGGQVYLPNIGYKTLSFSYIKRNGYIYVKGDGTQLWNSGTSSSTSSGTKTLDISGYDTIEIAAAGANFGQSAAHNIICTFK